MGGPIADGPGEHPPPRRALLLSGDLGAGHKVTAEAVSVVLAQTGWYSSVVDCMALLGSGGAVAGQAVFRRRRACRQVSVVILIRFRLFRKFLFR